MPGLGVQEHCAGSRIGEWPQGRSLLVGGCKVARSWWGTARSLALGWWVAAGRSLFAEAGVGESHAAMVHVCWVLTSAKALHDSAADVCKGAAVEELFEHCVDSDSTVTSCLVSGPRSPAHILREQRAGAIEHEQGHRAS